MSALGCVNHDPMNFLRIAIVDDVLEEYSRDDVGVINYGTATVPTEESRQLMYRLNYGGY